ncbi:MAG: pyridoxal 5'-phosphate synthase glutaminase subunit PdxT [Candidatus Altiarchaeales archaeon ex4484_2]|nr:MAG: pyridoxal 5'-phosphate synthase glutaminase subunit PdxT [Candidatus Altiarchaeales archaeon ex4484_2]
MKKIGVLSLQGDVSEHVSSMEKAVEKMELDAFVEAVSSEERLRDVDALVIPGGESTTLGKLIHMYGLAEVIMDLVKRDKPVMGTCAGMILLASRVEDNKYALDLMDVEVERNAFGRQRESFEKDISIKGFRGKYHAVFIRAPAIKRTWGVCELMAEVGGRGVMAKQGNLIVLSFHPELVHDTRVQELFLGLLD